MVLGCLLMLFGVLVAVMPQILVVLVSAFFISAGLVLCAVSWQWRQTKRRSKSTIVNWVIH